MRLFYVVSKKKKNSTTAKHSSTFYYYTSFRSHNKFSDANVILILQACASAMLLLMVVGLKSTMAWSTTVKRSYQFLRQRVICFKFEFGIHTRARTHTDTHTTHTHTDTHTNWHTHKTHTHTDTHTHTLTHTHVHKQHGDLVRQLFAPSGMEVDWTYPVSSNPKNHDVLHWCTLICFSPQCFQLLRKLLTSAVCFEYSPLVRSSV